ncbi:SUKH-4 family immunity protein [Priestia megaterium]|uniref:SUKH-4 family immunity protein n=1 Tax=Priestia megaterium TaxID=1404 RepID=UPI000BF9932D|nr:SUKH-4 family immunity protein [Priestia megaterium]PFR94846.1 hypothetical protein COK39_15030 [Priestia megaterium]
MILPKAFNNSWNVEKDGPLIKFEYATLQSTGFSEEVKQFLSLAGLPETPAPYLDFTSSQGVLKPITSIFSMSEEFQNCWFLGSTAAGDPICLTKETENVVFLDKSNGDKKVFINSSINQFAECLLVYSIMIDQAVQLNGEDAFIDNDIPESVIKWLKERLNNIDPKCMGSKCFWATEVGGFYGY